MTELYNKKNKQQLIDELNQENFSRVTLSFYKYVQLSNLDELRNSLYERWRDLNILGRVYIAEEGINAQISLPENNIDMFRSDLDNYSMFKNIPFKIALNKNTSFYNSLMIE